MLKDPVCGMDINTDSKFSAQYNQSTFHFCSESCLNKFQQSPAQYASKADNSNSDATALYTCPMHPEVQQQGPGRCPKCGMNLELSTS